MRQENSTREQPVIENPEKIFPIVKVHNLLLKRTRFPEEKQMDDQEEVFPIDRRPHSLWKKIALTELEEANQTNRKQTAMMNLEEDFSIKRKQFFFWKGISLIELAVEACTLYYDIEYAIDNKGHLKEGHQDKINNLHANLLPKISIGDCRMHIDSTCQKSVYETTDSLLELGLCCWLLYRYIIVNTFIRKDDIEHFIMCDSGLTKTVNRAIGCWTAKMEKRGKNPGAAAMKERGQKNAKAVREIIEQLNITSTGAFKKDKKLRDAFFRKAKEMTDCDSEDRIMKIARNQLKIRHSLNR